MMRTLIGAAFACALAGCATAPYPSMRPLTQSHIDNMGQTRVVVSENNHGVEKSWFMQDSTAAGSSYGLIGALVTVTMDAIMNAAPSARARKTADEIAVLFPAETLNASLLEHLGRQVAASEAAGVTFSEISGVQRLIAPETLDDAVEVQTSYTLSEDASMLRVTAVASYQSASTPYATPYTFEGSTPQAETIGPAYRNTFTYYSRQLPVPELTPELRERLIASIEESARNESGALPAEDSDEYRSYERELANARDNNLTKPEIAIFLGREWVRDDGAILRQEIEQAHDFIARYIAIDINRTAVPSLEGQDELLETGAGERTVRRVGAGIPAGSYISSPANVTSFATYGNAVGIARVNSERIEALRDRRRASSN